MLTTFNALEVLGRIGLDCNKSYFLFCGSFGDKWFIASMLEELLTTHANTRIIADKSDEKLLQIFLGESMARVLACEEHVITYLRNVCRQDPNCYMPCESQLAAEGTINCPPGLRSLHTADYPYFIHLSSRGCARYLDMLRIICFLSIDSIPRQPLYLSPAHHQDAEHLLRQAVLDPRTAAIFNIVNHSHESLSIEQQSALIASATFAGFAPVINVAGLGGDDLTKLNAIHCEVPLILIPGHLVKSVCDIAPIMLGALGGALSIADCFGSCSILTLATKSNFFSGYNTAIKRGVDLTRREDFVAEPRPTAPRLLKYISLPDSGAMNINNLKQDADVFFSQVSNL